MSPPSYRPINTDICITDQHNTANTTVSCCNTTESSVDTTKGSGYYLEQVMGPK